MPFVVLISVLVDKEVRGQEKDNFRRMDSFKDFHLEENDAGETNVDGLEKRG